MKRIHKAAVTSIGVALLWASLATGAQGRSSVPDSFSSEPSKNGGQLRGYIPCAGCLHEELDATPREPLARLSPLPAHWGLVGRQVHPENASLRYPRLWLKRGDPLFETVAAKRPLFKEVVVFGRLQESLPTHRH